MFVFFLTLGRYLEMRARHRSIDRGAALSQILPNTTTLLVDEKRTVVPVAQLAKGDIVIDSRRRPIPGRRLDCRRNNDRR